MKKRGESFRQATRVSYKKTALAQGKTLPEKPIGMLGNNLLL
ncbi:hypothetical protein [Anaerotignum sp.]|nr:hypothetical protein [Anaerotignum sp.]